jgi:signal transduction histidine kinase
MAKGRKRQVQVVDLNQLWLDIVALLGGQLEGKADVKLDLRPIPPVKRRPQQLSAVFSNLLPNAAGAIETRGTIRISSDHPGADVVVEVRDDGTRSWMPTFIPNLLSQPSDIDPRGLI